MRKFLISIILLQAVIVKAQTASEIHNKDTINTWEIGTDLLWLIDKNQVPATSLFVRYNFTNKKNKQMAWRLRLGVNTSRKDSSQIADPQDNEKYIFAPYLRSGIEWQNKTSAKSLVFYGVDASLSYSQEKIKTIVTTIPPPGVLSQEINKTLEAGLIGFIGFKYEPTAWFALSIESSLNIFYTIRRDEFKTTSIDFPDDEGFHGFIHTNEINIKFTPITIINLSFYLNRTNYEN